MEGIANRIRDLRIKSGRSDLEVSKACDLNIYEYGDLEAYDTEIIDVVLLEKAMKLSALFGCSLLGLLVPDRALWPKEVIPVKELHRLIDEKIGIRGITKDEAEEEIGWYITELLRDPVQYVNENPLMLLKDLAKFLEVDWLCIVPR